VTRIVDGAPPGDSPESLPGAGLPLEPAEGPAALAELLEAVIAGRGPPGATRAAIRTAELMLWACGIEADAAEALSSRRAARVLADLRL
jgi:hypothetical protein